MRAQYDGIDNRMPTPRRKRLGCLPWLFYYNVGLWAGLAAMALAVFAFFWFFPPQQTNILLLGIDRRPGESAVARTDTMILVGMAHRQPAVTMLSIPRDLWLTLLDGSENRINTAHFFAEAAVAGSGPQAAADTVALNFEVDVPYYVRIDFSGFVSIIDAAGGVTVDVAAPLIDYEYPTDDYGYMYVEFLPGQQTLSGERALQYARIRHGSSDFERAKRQQQVVTALISRMLNPLNWWRVPFVAQAAATSIETNMPPLMMIRMLPTVLKVGPAGINRIVIEGPMVQPTTTSGGASVQLPVWGNINPVLSAGFGYTGP